MSVDDTTITTAAPAEDVATDDAVLEAPALFRLVWADPQYMPEHIATWSLARFSPIAGRAVDKFRAREPTPDREQLEQLVITRQTRIAMTEGAFVGGPFVLLLPIAFCGALLAQGQMVFELAAVAGYDPTDHTRAAEILVLLEVYPTVEEASAALEQMAKHPSEAGKKLPRGTRWKMIMRMAYLLQVLGTGPERSRLRYILGWCGLIVLFVVGIVLPLVWVPYMAYVTRRGTLLLGNRARVYYAEKEAGDAGVVVRQRPMRVRVGGLAAFARTTILVVTPIVAALIGILTGFDFQGGRWVSAILLLIGISALATAAWFTFRWWRRRRRLRRAAAQA